jgi:hypothetical protein
MRRARTARCAAFVLLALSVPLLGGTCGTKPRLLTIDTPTDGTFTTASSILVEGLAQGNNGGQVFVNGVPQQIANGAYSVVVPLDPSKIVNPIIVESLPSTASVWRRRVTVIAADGVTSGFVLDGDRSPDSLGMRLTDTGLDQVSPVVESLSGDSLYIGDIITTTPPITGSFPLLGGLVNVPFTATPTEASFSGFGLDVDPMTGQLDATITIQDFFVEVDLEVLGSTCIIEIDTATADIGGGFDLQPLVSNPSFVDVNLVTPIGVRLGGFNAQFVGGICNDILIGDIINLVIGPSEMQALMESGFATNLADPDGAGPLDSPIAAAIETSLAGVSIAGPIGTAIGGMVDAEIVTVGEDTAGMTLAVDAAITANALAPGAPDLPASYAIDVPFPAFPPATPIDGLPYGLAFSISTSGLNQLMKAQIEGGLLQIDIDAFDIPPFGLQNLTTGVASIFVPELLPAYTGTEPVHFEVRPLLAPIMTGNPGPNGELTELLLSGLLLRGVVDGDDFAFVEIVIDLKAGVDLTFGPAGVAFAIGALDPANLDLTVTSNPLNTNEANLTLILTTFFPLFSTSLQDALAAFPIPALLGLELEAVEVARISQGFLGLFANLREIPAAKIENVVFADASTGDSVNSGGCFMGEWRHRLAGQHLGNRVNGTFRGMLGADSGCTTNDMTSNATLSYTVDFDISAGPTEAWTLDLAHDILGAFTIVSDGYTDSLCFKDGGADLAFLTPVTAAVSIDGGAPTPFDFTPAPSGFSDGRGGPSTNETHEFSGAAATQLAGTGPMHVRVDFGSDLQSFSNSSSVFLGDPFCQESNGDEAAIRLGKKDTIDNNFSAGGYPGQGNRSAGLDGHFATIVLTPVP